MKKIILLCAALILAASTAEAKPKRDKLEDVPNFTCGGQNTIIKFGIAGFSNYAPFSWREQDMETFRRTRRVEYRYDGFVVDAVRTALKEIKVVNVEEKMFDSTEELKKAAAHGKIDILFTTYYEGEGKTGLDYIYPAYFGNPVAVVSRIDKKIETANPQDFRGLKGVFRREEGLLSMVQGQLPTDAKVIEVDGAEQAFSKLLNGEVDFMITSPYAYYAEAGRLGIKDKLYLHPESLRPMKIFAAFSKLSPCRHLKTQFEAAFRAQFENKAEAEARMKKYIKLWADNKAPQE